MNIDILKEASVEYCENIYALAINYLRKNNNVKLDSLVKELVILEEDIRKCENIELLNAYKMLLESLISKIEGIIHE